jgi:hypothetical protein
MIIGRIIGWLLLIAAAITLANDVISWSHTGTWHLSSASEVWERLDAGSLTLVQAAVRRYVSPELWDPVIQTILQFYALLILAIPGLLLLWVTRSREKRERQARSSQMR